MFIPPFCPNKHCACHIKPPDFHSWYQNRGSYHTQSAGLIPRFSCTHCGRSFGRRTFSIDYFTKKLVDYHTLITFLSSCMGIRHISRATGLSIGTISNRTAYASTDSPVRPSH